MSDYKSNLLLTLKKNYCLQFLNSHEKPKNFEVLYRSQRIAIVIDLIPSMFSYHSGLRDIIYNSLRKTMSVLIKGLYASDIDIEVSILCTRMGSSPLHVMVHSYLLITDEYHELLSIIEDHLDEITLAYKKERDEGKSILFSTVLKWSLFALSMMDQSRLPTVILVTNTVDSFVNPAIYDGLIMQYCRNEVAFHVVSLCCPKRLRFGLASDYLVLKEAAKATGGVFFQAESLKSMVHKLFVRKAYLVKVEKNPEHLIEKYGIDLPIDKVLECRLREGFNIREISETVTLALHCGNKTLIKYKISKLDHYCSIELSLISSLETAKKIKELLKSTELKVKETEPLFHERVYWIIHNIKETENYSMSLWKAVNGLSSEKIYIKNINVWHRWFDVERIDIVTCKNNSEFSIQQGRKKLDEVMKTFSSTYENDIFLDVFKGSMMVGKIQWEGVNKVTLYIGCYGDIDLEKYKILLGLLKKCTWLEVYTKPLGKILVENISNAKKNNFSIVQSAETYRPHLEALKAYMLNKRTRYKLLSPNWTKKLLDFFYEFRLKKGYTYIGNCADNKILLYKHFKPKQVQNTIFFFQYVLYISKNKVIVEFYIDPELINHNQDYYKEQYKAIEEIDEFIYNSFFALEYLIFKSLRHKLHDEDFGCDDEVDGKIVKLTSRDDFYCYMTSLDSLKSYKKTKRLTLKSLVKVLSLNTDLPADHPPINLLLNHSNIHLVSFQTFKLLTTYKFGTKVFGKLFTNLLSAYSDISDCSITECNLHHYVRYLSEDSVLIWTLPSLDEFILKTTETYNVVMEFYECSLGKIDSGNMNSTGFNKTSSSQSEVLQRNISLVHKVYKSALNFTYCEICDEVEFSSKALKLVIDACTVETQVVDIQSLYSLINPQWRTTTELARNLIKKTVLLMADAFTEMDSLFSAFLIKSFTKVPNSDYYILHNREQGIFLKFGKTSCGLSSCLADQEIVFSLYKSSYQNFFSKEIRILQKQTHYESSEILQSICKCATNLLSTQALDLLAQMRKVSEERIIEVMHHMALVNGTVDYVVPLDLIIQNQDFSELIHLEMMNNKILYTRSVGGRYVLVNTEAEKNFFIEKDYEKETCPVSSSESQDFFIDFWLIIEVVPMNSIKFTYFFPPNLEFSGLNSVKLKFDLIKHIKKIEIRVNQRILLKNLLETGKISSMLLQAECDNPPLDNNKLTENRIWLQKQEIVRRKPSIKPQGSYKLQLQHSHDFPITDRLVKLDSINALSSKFSIPPFSIDNLEDTYMLVQSQNVWLFKFIEVQGQVSTTFQGLSKSQSHDKSIINVRYIRLQIFGIDAPPDDTISKLEKIVEDQLQQTSLAKLADSLIKNQKKAMTSNDYQFILGSALPDIIYYQVTPFATDLDLLLSIAKQNVLRFLSPFKLMDSIVMIYNYLTIIDTSSSKNTRSLLYKHYTANNNYLGSTFGKALALVSFDIVYFDGENITQDLTLVDQTDWNYSKLQIQGEVRTLQKHSGMIRPSSPGYYIEVKISKNGNFYTSAFIEQLDSCISQSIFEYILEKILTSSQILNIHERYFYISECALTAMVNSLKVPTLEIPHYTSWTNLFLFYSQIFKITEEQIDFALKFRYGMEMKGEKWSSGVLKEIEDKWTGVCDEEFASDEIRFTAMAGPDFISEVHNDDIKFYASEQMWGTYLARSVFVYIEIGSQHIQVFTYNLHRSVLAKVHYAIESHIHWAKERYMLLNSSIMQKLGLFYHRLNTDKVKNGNPEENNSLVLPKACALLELKETNRKFMLESLTNPHEILHTDGNCDGNFQEFKLKGVYPLIRYGLGKFNDIDVVKRFGLYMSSFINQKIEHANEYEICAYAYMKWASKKNLQIDRMISKVSKNAVIRDEMHLVKEIIKSCFLFFKENAKYYIQSNSAGKANKNQYVLCEVLKMYSDKLAKITKFDSPIQSDSKSNRKNSLEDLENPVKYVKTFYSSGALLNEPKADIMQSFLKKSFNQSLIIIEVCYENDMISTNGYCIEDFFKCFPFYRWEDFKCSQGLVKELSRLKLAMDSVSVIYDIQIKCISNCLSNPKEYSDIDIIKTLTLLSNDFQKAPRRSTNSVVSFSFFMSFGENPHISPHELFIFFMLNSKECGYQSYTLGSKSQCVFRKVKEREDTLKNSETLARWFVYTKGRSKFSEHSDELVIKCFIVVYDESRKSKSDSVKVLKQYAEREFSEALTTCKEYYRRDQLWNTIRESTHFSFHDLELLLGASKVTHMYDIDPRIRYLTSFKNVFTYECINYLQEVYSKNSKVLEIQDQVHLIVIFSQRNFAQLILNREHQCLQMLSVTRIIGSNIHDEEISITDLINKIVQWLWVRVITN